MKTFENENNEIILYSQCNAFQTLGCLEIFFFLVILLVSFVKLNAFTVGTQLSTEYTLFHLLWKLNFINKQKQNAMRNHLKFSEIARIE